MAISISSCAGTKSDDRGQAKKDTIMQMKQLGAMKPKEALEYMLHTPDLVIIDTREPQYIDKQFNGCLSIPYTQMAERYKEIPEGRPVMLHCGLGWVAPKAYKTLVEKNPKIKELSYIDGAPLFDEYNKNKK